MDRTSREEEEQRQRDELLLSYAKKLLQQQQQQQQLIRGDENYLAALISLSKLSSPLPVEVFVQEQMLNENMISFLLRLISSYLHHNTKGEEQVYYYYLTLSINLLHYIILSSAALTTESLSVVRPVVTNLVHRAIPFLLQVLQIHSSSSSEFNTAAIIPVDSQIVEILYCILVYYYFDEEDQYYDSNSFLVPILLRYRSLITVQKSTPSPEPEQNIIIAEYRKHLTSILHHILHNSFSSSSSLFLRGSSKALVEFLDLALTHDSTFYSFALQWSKQLFHLSSNDDDGEESSDWTQLLLHNSNVQTLFSNLIVFGFQHYYNTCDSSIYDSSAGKNQDDGTTVNSSGNSSTSAASTTSRLISCDLFETVALALETVGGIWAIKSCESEQNVTSVAAASAAAAATIPYNNRILESTRNMSDPLLTVIIRMASGEIRILLGWILEIGRDDQYVQNKDEQQNPLIVLANTVLHCTRILLTVVKDLVDDDDEKDMIIMEKRKNWVRLLHFETVLKIKECMETAMQAMFEFVAAATPVTTNDDLSIATKDLPLFDSVLMLCTKCLKVWLAENYNNNAPIIHTSNEHELSILRTLVQEATDAPDKNDAK